MFLIQRLTIFLQYYTASMIYVISPKQKQNELVSNTNINTGWDNLYFT